MCMSKDACRLADVHVVRLRRGLAILEPLASCLWHPVVSGVLFSRRSERDLTPLDRVLYFKFIEPLDIKRAISVVGFDLATLWF